MTASFRKTSMPHLCLLACLRPGQREMGEPTQIVSPLCKPPSRSATRQFLPVQARDDAKEVEPPNDTKKEPPTTAGVYSRGVSRENRTVETVLNCKRWCYRGSSLCYIWVSVGIDR